MLEGELRMAHFSANEITMMRKVQSNKCARCLSELGENEGEAHEIFRDNNYKLNGVLLCENCHKPRHSYMIPPLRIGDPLNLLI